MVSSWLNNRAFELPCPGLLRHSDPAMQRFEARLDVPELDLGISTSMFTNRYYRSRTSSEAQSFAWSLLVIEFTERRA